MNRQSIFTRYVVHRHNSQPVRGALLLLAALTSVILAGCANVAATTVSLAPQDSRYPVTPHAATPATAGEHGEFCAVLNRYLWAPVSAAEDAGIAADYNDETARELAAAEPPRAVAGDWAYLVPWFADYVHLANAANAHPSDARLRYALRAQQETIEAASYRQHFDSLGAWADTNCQ